MSTMDQRCTNRSEHWNSLGLQHPALLRALWCPNLPEHRCREDQWFYFLYSLVFKKGTKLFSIDNTALLFGTVTSSKFINSTSCIHNFLLAGIERMTGRTNFDTQVFLECWFSLKDVATWTGDSYFIVSWMYVFFHCKSLNWFPENALYSMLIFQARKHNH